MASHSHYVICALESEQSPAFPDKMEGLDCPEIKALANQSDIVLPLQSETAPLKVDKRENTGVDVF